MKDLKSRISILVIMTVVKTCIKLITIWIVQDSTNSFSAFSNVVTTVNPTMIKTTDQAIQPENLTISLLAIGGAFLISILLLSLIWIVKRYQTYSYK